MARMLRCCLTNEDGSVCDQLPILEADFFGGYRISCPSQHHIRAIAFGKTKRLVIHEWNDGMKVIAEREGLIGD